MGLLFWVQWSAISLAVLVAAGLTFLGFAPRRDDYIASNRLLIARAGSPEGSAKFGELHTEQHATEFGPVSGYTTIACYAAPPGMSFAEVLSFYDGSLGSSAAAARAPIAAADGDLTSASGVFGPAAARYQVGGFTVEVVGGRICPELPPGGGAAYFISADHRR